MLEIFPQAPVLGPPIKLRKRAKFGAAHRGHPGGQKSNGTEGEITSFWRCILCHKKQQDDCPPWRQPLRALYPWFRYAHSRDTRRLQSDAFKRGTMLARRDRSQSLKITSGIFFDPRISGSINGPGWGSITISWCPWLILGHVVAFSRRSGKKKCHLIRFYPVAVAWPDNSDSM